LKRAIVVVLVGACWMALTACGNKGDLVLPAAAAVQEEPNIALPSTSPADARVSESRAPDDGELIDLSTLESELERTRKKKNTND